MTERRISRMRWEDADLLTQKMDVLWELEKREAIDNTLELATPMGVVHARGDRYLMDQIRDAYSWSRAFSPFRADQTPLVSVGLDGRPFIPYPKLFDAMCQTEGSHTATGLLGYQLGILGYKLEDIDDLITDLLSDYQPIYSNPG